MNITDIVKKVLLTTENSEDTFLILIENRSKEIKEKVLEYLSHPFSDLENQFISPLIFFEGTFEYRYSESDYEKAYNEINRTSSILLQDEVQYRATEKWIEGKREELKSLLIKNGKKKENKNEKIPSFQKGLKISEEQLDKLFLALNELNLIKENNSELFKQCFLGGKLEKQPQIKFYEQPQILYYLFKLMDDHGVITDYERSKIFTK